MGAGEGERDMIGMGVSVKGNIKGARELEGVCGGKWRGGEGVWVGAAWWTGKTANSVVTKGNEAPLQPLCRAVACRG